MRIWDAATGTARATLTGLTGHTAPVLAAAIAPNGTWLATAGSGDDRTVQVWDTTTGTTCTVLSGHTGLVEAVAISRDCTWLATCSDDGTLRIWDLADLASGARSTGPATLMRVSGELQCVAWAGDRVYAGGRRGLFGFRLVGSHRDVA